MYTALLLLQLGWLVFFLFNLNDLILNFWVPFHECPKTDISLRPNQKPNKSIAVYRIDTFVIMH